jgi:hypothetical protein
MNGEQTITSDTSGTQTPSTTEDAQDTNQPTSIYEKTEAIVVRQEAANKKTEELLARQETLHANQRLAGTSGGHVKAKPAPEISDEEYSKQVMRGEVGTKKSD